MVTLKIGSIQAETGTKVEGSLQAFKMTGGGARIPVTLINGTHDGPVLNLNAGVHGDEFEGIRAIWAILDQLAPDDLSGAIIATPIVHMAAYWAGSRESPVDGKNLARVFPGNSRGTATDKLADFFLKEIVFRSDYVISLHSGGLKYKFHPLVEYYTDVEKRIELKARSMAQFFSIGPFSVVRSIKAPPTNITCSYEACRHGIPSIEAEMWGEGRCLKQHVDQYVDSVMNVLRYLGMVRGEAIQPARDLDYVEGQWITADNDGLFIPKVEIRQTVEQGQEIGVITDEAGKSIEDVRANAEGFVGALRTFPLIRPGDWVVLILKPVSQK